jgi:ribulose-phosphate 3-epimerase
MCLTEDAVRQVASFYHVDVLDGTLFPETCFFDPTGIDPELLPRVELHLMTNNPLPVIELWKQTGKLARAYVHVEMQGDIVSVLQYLRENEIESALAVNAHTPIEAITDYMKYADTLLILGVPAGKSGQKFLGEMILQKILEAKTLFEHGPILVDGGITLENAKEILNLGVASLCVNSAIYKAPDPLLAYQSFEQLALPNS